MFPWAWQVGTWPQPGTPQEPQSLFQPFLWHLEFTWAGTLGQISGVVFGEECKKQVREGSLFCCVFALPCNPWHGEFLSSLLSSGSRHPGKADLSWENPPTPVPLQLSCFPLHCAETPTLPSPLGCLCSLEPLLCSCFFPNEEHLPWMDSHTPWAWLFIASTGCYFHQTHFSPSLLQNSIKVLVHDPHPPSCAPCSLRVEVGVHFIWF